MHVTVTISGHLSSGTLKSKSKNFLELFKLKKRVSKQKL